MNSWLVQFDHHVIRRIRTSADPIARVALFVIFFWFGVLKVAGESPANPLVAELLAHTLRISFDSFIVWFGLYEMLIGLAFLVPRRERLAIGLLIPHMVATFLPLLLIAPMTWKGPLVPTLEGQYIIKNLVIIALALSIAARLHPLRRR